MYLSADGQSSLLAASSKKRVNLKEKKLTITMHVCCVHLMPYNPVNNYAKNGCRRWMDLRQAQIPPQRLFSLQGSHGHTSSTRYVCAAHDGRVALARGLARRP